MSADKIAVLEKAYTDLVSERDRLRDARASFTGRLGPLPPSAAIVIGLVGSVGTKVNALWIVEAAVLLVVIISISIVYSGMRPYRLIRGELQREFDPGRPEPDRGELGFGVVGVASPALWLKKKIGLEEMICGPLRETQKFSLSWDVANLQDALNVERWAFVLVQILFAEIIVVLVFGIAMRDCDLAVQRGVGTGIALVTLVGLLVALRRGLSKVRGAAE